MSFSNPSEAPAWFGIWVLLILGGEVQGRRQLMFVPWKVERQTNNCPKCPQNERSFVWKLAQHPRLGRSLSLPMMRRVLY